MAKGPPELTAKELTQLARLAGYGLTHAQIADWFGFSTRTLRNRIKEGEGAAAYKTGRARAIKKVSGKLFANACKGDRVSQMFWLKCQAGWRETDKEERPDVEALAREMIAAMRSMEATVGGGNDDG